MKKLLIAILVFCASAYIAKADPNEPNCPDKSYHKNNETNIAEPNDPLIILKQKWGQIENILTEPNIVQKEKEDRVDAIASEMFDFPLMAKLALGKKHWNQMTDTQSEMFTELFVKKLKDAYRGKVSLYDGQKVIFKEALQKKKAVHIPMVLMSDDKEIVILYKFYQPGKNAKSWKVYDVEIQAISIVKTYRSQFEDILERKTIDDLLAKLQDPKTD